ncbi:MAG: putative type VI secretion system effector [Acinetobacter sp.]
MNMDDEKSNGDERVVLLRGCIQNYRLQSKRMNFFAAQVEQQGLAAASAGAAMAGLSGLAAGAALMASDDMEEEVDYVQFDLEGQAIEGFLWQSPFREGDEVQVVAEMWPSGIYQAFGICRPLDKIIALRPHCTRGKIAHYWMSWRFFLRWFFMITVSTIVLIGVVGLIKGGVNWGGLGKPADGYIRRARIEFCFFGMACPSGF